jgi:gamma-glutamyl phosphate reductase
MTLKEQMAHLARQAKEASRQLAKLSEADKNYCLLAMAEGLKKNAEAMYS